MHFRHSQSAVISLIFNSVIIKAIRLVWHCLLLGASPVVLAPGNPLVCILHICILYFAFRTFPFCILHFVFCILHLDFCILYFFVFCCLHQHDPMFYWVISKSCCFTFLAGFSLLSFLRRVVFCIFCFPDQ